MARGIQPLATPEDGDALYAVSTQEIAGDESSLPLEALYVAAGEAMWDAILASVPEEPAFVPPSAATIPADRLTALAGQYRFGREAVVKITIENGKAMLRTLGNPYLDLQAEPVALTPISATEFYVKSRSIPALPSQSARAETRRPRRSTPADGRCMARGCPTSWRRGPLTLERTISRVWVAAKFPRERGSAKCSQCSATRKGSAKSQSPGGFGIWFPDRSSFGQPLWTRSLTASAALSGRGYKRDAADDRPYGRR